MSYSKQLTRFCLALTALATSSIAIQAGSPTGALSKYAESRSWSNDTGQFRIDGKLQSAEDNKVKILKSDNRVITVPLDKLSEEDQKFVNEFLAAEAKQESPANPFAGGEKANPFAGGQPASAMLNDPSQGGIPQKMAVVGGVRPITASPSPGLWDVKPPFALPPLKLHDTIVPLNLPKPFASKLTIGAGGRGPTVVLNNYKQSHRQEENISRFVIYDPVTEQASPIVEYNQPWKLMSVAPNGGMMVAVRDNGWGRGSDLALFKIEDNQLKPLYWFNAVAGDREEIYWASFLPGNRLATISSEKLVIIWDLNNPAGPKAVYQGSTGGPKKAITSPAGELMIFPAGNNIAVVDTINAKLAGWIERETAPTELALSSDGRTLAAFHPFAVTLYSMETGAELKKFAVSHGFSEVNFRWIGDHLMVGNVVYDVQRELAIWNYQGLPDGYDVYYGDYHLAAFGEDKRTTLTIFKLPHAAALAAAENVDPLAVYAMRPGDGVKVVFNLSGAPAQVQQDAQNAVQAKIDELGWVKLDNAVTVMEITVEPLKQDTQDYYVRKGFGPFFAPSFGQPTGPKETVTFTPWKHSLVIKVGGKQIYSTGYTRSAPQNLQLKENESPQAAVNRIVQPDGKSFKTMKVPPHLLKPEYQGGMGSSRLTKAGLN
ncbi:hypothetical protein DTL42_02940 [Bremerella cremea]|uniref:SLA1 homology domain-containing protein n=1 Tax=Bremerella cremea TaxID=1031537 RepID=A0A368KY57_9BACT|nr:SHD1 domain-containing protein [Bremerella cremea]RCS54122.1 hypothetical protein DTL42_02940 [Bremerella cremea]